MITFSFAVAKNTVCDAGRRFSVSAVLLALSTLGFVSICKAAPHSPDRDSVVITATGSSIDPAEEARKVRRLAKLALYPNATAETKKSLSDEISYVEHNRKLKEAVVKHLLQDDDPNPDPTLPKIQMATYKDGSLRGIMFIQSDAAHSAKPGRIAWVLDSKKEKKETGHE